MLRNNANSSTLSGTSRPEIPLPRPVFLSGSDAVVTKTVNRPAGGGPLGRTAIVAGFVAGCALCLRYLPERLWGLLVVMSTPTLLAVQLPQIWKNWRQKHTGELATLTVLLAFTGSSIRIATTIAVRRRAWSGGQPANRTRSP